MKNKLFETLNIDLAKLIITVLLVVVTLFGQDFKQHLTDDNKVKFVLDSYYNFEKSQGS